MRQHYSGPTGIAAAVRKILLAYTTKHTVPAGEFQALLRAVHLSVAGLADARHGSAPSKRSQSPKSPGYRGES